MDVDHEGVTLPRRIPRRAPVGLPYSAPPLPILEDEWEVPGWIWFAIGAGVTAAALACTCYVACAVWLDRELRG